MVKSKGIPVPISTIYYWIHHGHLGLTKADMLYPRQEKAKKKHASPNFKPAGKSIEERPESISIINLLKSFYRLANLNLKFGLVEVMTNL